MKTKYFLQKLLILVLVIFIVSGCGTTETKEVENDNPQTTNATQQENSNDKQDNNSVQSKKEAAIEEQVLLEYGDVKITAKGLGENFMGPELKILIENDSSSDVTVSLDDVVVNNYMMSGFLYETVAAGKKSNTSFSIYDSSLANAGIENIGKIELYFSLVDPNSYNTIYESDLIEIKTSLFGEMDETPNDLGKELVNQNGIRIVGKYFNKNSIWGNSVVLYIENNTDRNIMVSADDISVNGFMITALFAEGVRPNRKAIGVMYLSSGDLEENGIETVEEISTKFEVYDADSYRAILQTDEVSFSIE